MKSQNTSPWKSAELQYSSLHAAQAMPFAGLSLSPAEVTERLADIVRTCPKFYPAVLELGIRRLAEGAGPAEDKRILKGLRLLFELGDPEQADDEIEILIENPEHIWRYDVAQRCLELLVERQPQKVLFRDYLAHATAKLGNVEAALQHAAQAVAMAPANSHFRSNLGLYHLMAGNLDEARKHLTAAQRQDPENEVIRGNLVILDYLSEHGGKLLDYLLRPVDEGQIERLSAAEDFEELDPLCASYNRDRLAALGQHLACDEAKRARGAITITSLSNFFSFVDRVANLTDFLHERLAFVQQHFEAILHKFIYKFGDVDRQMLADIFDGLLEYYGFLAQSGLVSAAEFQRFQRLVRDERPKLLKKMERYNAVRHDDGVGEAEKEAIRQELFAGDHTWPHL